MENILEFNNDDEFLNDEFNENLISKFNICKQKINESKIKLINLKKNDIIYQEKISVTIKKYLLIDHIQLKLNKLYQKLRLLDLKNIKYKKCYDLFNISIIILSSSLTVIEATKVAIDDTYNIINSFRDYFFKMSSIIFSSTITLSASILKFKKYQEKMENICKTIEKGTFIISNLKKIKEELIFCNEIKCFTKIKEKYSKEVFVGYSNINQEIDRILKNDDYDKYLEYIYNTDFKIHILNEKRKYFFNNFKLNNEDICYNLNKKIKHKNCCF